jgi:hypothetical protein
VSDSKGTDENYGAITLILGGYMVNIIQNKSGTVDSTSDIYDVMNENWQLPVTLMGGEKAMREAGRLYLPKEPKESDAMYTNRLLRSTLKNYYSWAVENHTGRVFKSPIVISDDTDETIKKYNKDLDLQGNDVNAFYRAVFKDMLIKGISYVYVDFPRTMADMSLADEVQANLRPYCIHIKAEQVISAVPGIVNGRVVLIRAHIREVVTAPYGEWGTTTYEQIRVLYPGYWELYRQNTKSNSWEIVDAGETSLDYIPLVPLYGNKFGFFAAESPLQNLAYLNRAHWQSMSDQMNITHVARVPILYGTGFDEEDSLTVGTNNAVMGPEGSALAFVEHSGKAIEAGMTELKDLEDRMMLESLELLSESNTETATSRSLDISDINCSLQTLAMKLQEVINRVNTIMADWDGIVNNGIVMVSTDFGLQLRDGSESNILLKMRQNKSLSLPAFQKEMKRRRILAADFDIEEDIRLLEEEAKKQALPSEQPYVDENGKQIVGDENAEDLDTGKPRVE